MQTMKCSAYIATSADGFIANKDGSVDWIDSAGDASIDMGFDEFMDSVDCLIMGRGCMEAISRFDLAPAQWPYLNVRVIALSNTLKEPSENLRDRVEMYSGDLRALMAQLESDGHQHAYIDGGKTIQSFLAQQLINEITLTRVPVILGEGIPLFGKTSQDIRLRNARATVFPNDFVQLRYTVNYD